MNRQEAVSHVFLSYARADQASAGWMAKALEGSGAAFETVVWFLPASLD